LNWNFLYSTIRFVIVLLIIVAGAVSLYYVSTVTYPFLIALVLAFLMNPLVNLLNRKARLPRSFAVLVSLILIFGVIAGLATLVISEMISGVAYLTRVIPDKAEKLVSYFQDLFFSEIMPLYDRIMQMFNSLDPNQRATITNNIEKISSNVGTTLSQLGQNTVAGLSNFIVALPNFFTVLVFALLATFFISKNWYRFGAVISNKIPHRVASSAKKVYSELKKALLGFLKAQLTLISITAVTVLVGLLILRVEHALTIAVITGAVDLLPYLGTGAVFIPWIIYMFFTGNYFLTIGLSILYAVVIIQRQMIEPKVLSSSIGLDPLATLIALFVGFQLFGFLGLIIGPVLLVIIKTLHKANVFRELWRFIIGKPA
jgi:sporulation integral membrane protein YtvI